MGTEPSAGLELLSGWAYDEALRCVKCGFCLQACPTYRQTGLETASPRGRLALVRAMVEGVLPLDDATAAPLYLCLGCRACETACPSGLKYGRVLEGARAALEPALDASRSPGERLLRWLGFRHLLPRRRLLRAAVGLAGAGRAVAGLLPAHLRTMAGSLPALPPRRLRREWDRLAALGAVPARGPRRYRVAFFPGCVMDALFLAVNLATVRVLAAYGCEVVILTGSTCCGALHAHSGRLEEARALARQNAAAVPADVDAIINNAGGCGAHLREYGHLIPEGAEFARRSRDLSQWLAEIGPGPATAFRPLPLTVTYQDSCHLAHGQQVKAAPRQLLRSIPGLTYVEMPDADRCCGSAGIYNLLQPEMAGALLREKMASVAATGAPVVVTANPGCHLQLLAGARQAGAPVQVRHLAEILAASLA